MTEQQNIEYKQSWHNDYLKWICGFANAFGGIIYIGKDDNGKVVHLSDYKRLMETIPQKVRNDMGIVCDVNLLDEEGSKCIEIRVNSYSVPVSLRGRYYYRSGSVKTELTGVELNEFLLKKAGKTWDDVVEEGATVDDIDEKSLQAFIDASREKGRMPDTTGLSTYQILDKLRLTEAGKLKRAAIILFGTDPNRFYPNIQVKIGRFGKDSTDLKFQEVIEGNLVQMLDAVQQQLSYKFLTRPVEFTGMQRIEREQYPVAALREMLLNAMVHRTYMGASVQMRVFDNRLSIWNEGMLPIGLSLVDLKVEHNSRPRNPKIADACFLAGYIDTWGRGTLKIINSCKEAGLPEPEIKEMNGGIKVTVFNNLKTEISEKPHLDFGTISDRLERSTEENLEFLRNIYNDFTENINKDFGITSDKLRISFGITSDKKITNPFYAFQLLVLYPDITAEQIGSILGVSSRSAETYIKQSREENLIERIGGKKEGYWKIINPKN
ncbi:ATP-binding protein [uncultured Draconibacterium sp.]|uniref:ATP-binding protein n=1 Tax=uncultured Draconibacterium sp. TaxID=1573823 RepID=UPI0029C884B5|nr:ATP-binding protein [uncultured Draconibacterium sp.]